MSTAEQKAENLSSTHNAGSSSAKSAPERGRTRWARRTGKGWKSRGLAAPTRSSDAAPQLIRRHLAVVVAVETLERARRARPLGPRDRPAAILVERLEALVEPRRDACLALLPGLRGTPLGQHGHRQGNDEGRDTRQHEHPSHCASRIRVAVTLDRRRRLQVERRLDSG